MLCRASRSRADRTNSSACVIGAFPWRRARSAPRSVSGSGMISTLRETPKSQRFPISCLSTFRRSRGYRRNRPGGAARRASGVAGISATHRKYSRKTGEATVSRITPPAKDTIHSVADVRFDLPPRIRAGCRFHPDRPSWQPFPQRCPNPRAGSARARSQRRAGALSGTRAVRVFE